MKNIWIHAFMAACLAALFPASVWSASTGMDGTSRPMGGLRFQNPNPTDLYLTLSGGIDGNFRLPANGTLAVAAPSGADTTIRIQLPHPVDADVQTPPAEDAKRSVPVMPPERSGGASASLAFLDFRNTLGVSVLVTPGKGWNANPFLVPAHGNNIRQVRPETKLEYGVSIPISSDYEKEASLSVTTPAVGRTNPVNLTLKPRATPEVGLQIMTLDNTKNDVNVFAEWNGNKGARGNGWVEAGKTFPVPLDIGEAVTVSYFVNDTDYEEYSRANARKVDNIKADSGSFELRLAKRPAPVLRLRNTGRVDLDVRLEGEGMSPKKGMLKSGNSPISFSGLPKNKQMTLKWFPVAGSDPKWQGGSRDVGPYGLGETREESIGATERTRPRIVVRNESGRPVKAWVEDKNGKTVARKERMEGWEEWTVSVDAGTYRVRTEGIWEKHDGNAYKDTARMYEKTDEKVECQWGGRTREVICSGLPSRNVLEEGNNSSEYDEATLIGNLREAKHLVAEMGGKDIFQPEAYVQGCDHALQIAKKRKLVLKEQNADELMRDKGAYGEFQRAVADAFYEGGNSAIRGTWDHIADTARRSQSWEQFLANY